MGRPVTRLFALVIICCFLFSGLVVHNEDTTLSVDALEQGRNEDLEVTGTQNLVSVNYNSIWINGGTLTIKLGSVTVKESLNITNGGSLIMEEGAILRISNGTFDATDAERVEIRGELVVTNEVIDVPGSNEGEPSSIDIVASGNKPVVLQNAKITCTGGAGNNAGSTGTGFDGGDASIVIRTTMKTNIEIDNLELRVEGGAGGKSCPNAGNSGGAGGEASLIVNSEKDLEIKDSAFIAKGGDGGTGIDNGKDGHGGNSVDCSFISDEDINIELSHFESFGGSSSTNVGASEINFEGAYVGFDVMHAMGSCMENNSFIRSDAIDIKAKKGAQLHETDVDQGKVQAKDSRTDIEFYWWLKVIVQDGMGNEIEGASVEISDETGGTVKDGQTTASGTVCFELMARSKTDSTNDLKKFRAVASHLNVVGGGGTDVTLNMNTEIIIVLDLVEVEITELWDQCSLSYEKGDTHTPIVGGIMTITGSTSASPGTSPGIQFVKLKIESIDGSSAAWMDANPSIGGSWDRWHFVWNTTNEIEYPDEKEYMITAKTGDGLFEAFVNLAVYLDQDGFNHPPVVTTIEGVPETFLVDDSMTDQNLLIEGWAHDEDWDSSLLSVGKRIENVFISFRLDNNSSNEIRIYPATFTEEGNGDYHWSFTWDMEEIQEREYLFPDGTYIIEVWAVDDGGVNSTCMDVITETFNLKRPKMPIADIAFISCEKESLVYKKELSKTTDTGNFREENLEVTNDSVVAYLEDEGEGRGSVTLRFDAGSYWTEDGRIIGSYDEDGEIKNTDGSTIEEWDEDLTFYWILEAPHTEITSDELDGDSGDGWSANPDIEIALNMQDGDWEESRDEIYNIIVTVRDCDNIEKSDEVQLTLRYIPEDAYQSDSSSRTSYWSVYIIIVIVIALIACLFFIHLIRKNILQQSDKKKP